MDKKKISGIILLIFVALSVIVLIAKEMTKNTSTTEVNVPQKQETQLKHHLKVFYFHGTMRCPSCKKIEAYTRETITSRYKSEMDSGLIEFSEVNVDKPENEKYIEQYQLTTKQVIVSEYENGIEKKWKDLDRVWELLREEEDFKSYVEMEVNGWLNEVKK
ncbi:MAG TPA: nitrophenyl compound nitroreductase subunit ArsF family protein [bacterium]|nr:nitrophenyl compound nitroreductase subunit ArsF family protein [bacterium]